MSEVNFLRNQPPRYEDDKEDEDRPCRSFELDDDNDDLPFSQSILDVYVSDHFVLSKIWGTKEEVSKKKHLNIYKTQMDLRRVTPVLKCNHLSNPLRRNKNVLQHAPP